jgi:LysW-gamma-L-lysine carboxypeptidase
MKTVDYVVIGEPSNTHNITIGYRGSIVITLTINTEPGHTSNPNVRNAIEDFLTIHQRFLSRLPMTENEGKHRKLTIRPTWIKALTADNLHVYYNIRVPYNLTCDMVFAALTEIIDEFNAEDNFAKITMKVVDHVDPYQLKHKNNTLLMNLREIISQTTGKPPRLIRKTGTADLNILGNAFPHIPMFAYGPGDSRLDHTNEEHILFEDLHAAIQYLKTALKNTLSSDS